MTTFFKFLAENLQSKDGFVYDLPQWNGKEWKPSSWVEEPNAVKDGQACGVGLHLMKIPKPAFVRYVVGFVAEGDGLCGEDDEKARFKRVRLLRPLLKSEIFRPKADLQGAHLRGADLQGADLQGADLRGADLQGAHLQGAHLQGAVLQGADLQGAHGIKGILADELTREAHC